MRTAVRRGILQNEAGQYSLAACTAADYEGDHLIAAPASSINGAWTDRDEAIRATARHLGHRRAGPAFQQALRSAINGAIRRQLLESNGPQIRKTGRNSKVKPSAPSKNAEPERRLRALSIRQPAAEAIMATAPRELSIAANQPTFAGESKSTPALGITPPKRMPRT